MTILDVFETFFGFTRTKTKNADRNRRRKEIMALVPSNITVQTNRYAVAYAMAHMQENNENLFANPIHAYLCGLDF